ncbi:MAG: transposase [Verrucomicrobiota bacterium]
MRHSRLRGEGLSYYHCMSRVVDRRQIFDDAEKERFVGIMRKLEAFHGMRVVTYCVMSNHFHLLVEEPDAKEVRDLNRETLLERAAHLYNAASIRDLTEELDRAELGGNPKALQDILDRYQERMGDVFPHTKLPISVELKSQIGRLIDRYDTSVDWDYPPDPTPWSEEQCSEFNEAVRDMILQLARELSHDYETVNEFNPISKPTERGRDDEPDSVVD